MKGQGPTIVDMSSPYEMIRAKCQCMAGWSRPVSGPGAMRHFRLVELGLQRLSGSDPLGLSEVAPQLSEP